MDLYRFSLGLGSIDKVELTNITLDKDAESFIKELITTN